MVSSLTPVSSTPANLETLELQVKDRIWGDGELENLIKPSFKLLGLKRSRSFFPFRPTQRQVHQQAVLLLSIHFSEQTVPFDDDASKSLSFGLKGLELRVRISNGSMPYENRAKGNGQLFSDHHIRSYGTDMISVTSRGSDTSPVWSFEVNSEVSMLQGTLEVDLGIITILSYPLVLEATFRASPMDIFLSRSEDLWDLELTQKLTRNKLAVLERAIALQYMKPLLGNSLLQIKMQHGR